ncbi:FAD:protein FMN transferase [Cocleimonas sp. KMM 6892]|uniref:FAD:protein FMN transferase n=1 Tax=unclassified Cocleimonas TaxID=2639732 RepID=UPI002DB58935|nr:MULTISPECIES: FAD:protein FMN transferase [unclassified Cocleimonas]MEB8431300.1 FAD:protein FMN transferase [Cocleimonas sp. KMM 6892]MEC4713928.1 FAD:protein FMN transferase [Cocleimonas sp. KMM 6895]MEC4743259.1 FAD:protein FMN transferase [Cocleimonas sp. KMM 6896]
MGTSYHITLITTQKNQDKQSALQLDIDNLLKDINHKMSTYQSDSEISQFNATPSLEWIPISQDFYNVVDSALLISNLSGGYFDITISPLVNLWGFGPKIKINTPKNDDIKEAMSHIGYQKLGTQKETNSLKKTDPLLTIDLSSIAKGYAVDKVSDYLSSKSIANHLVEIGGEVKAKGKNLSNKKWRIAIENPDADSRAVNSLLELDNTAVATSGDYRNYYVENNERQSHIIDPKTGYPIKHKLASVTVVNPSTMLADAWATTLMVLGEAKGKELVIEQGLSVQMIIRNGNGFTTWKNKMP